MNGAAYGVKARSKPSSPSFQRPHFLAIAARVQNLEYWRLPERDHGGIVAPDSPLGKALIRWSRERFAGELHAAACQEATIQ